MTNSNGNAMMPYLAKLVAVEDMAPEIKLFRA